MFFQPIPTEDKITFTNKEGKHETGTKIRLRNGFCHEVLTSVDIQEIVKAGGRIIRILENFKTPPYRDYILILRDLRNKYKREGNIVGSNCMKLLGNSLYGKSIEKDIFTTKHLWNEATLQANFDSHIKTYEKINDSQYIVETEIEEKEITAEDMDKTSQLQNLISKLDDKITKVKIDVQRLIDNPNVNEGRLKRKLTALERKLGELLAELDKTADKTELQNSISNLNEKIAKQKSDVQDIINTLPIDKDTLKRQLTALDTKITDELEKEVGVIKNFLQNKFRDDMKNYIKEQVNLLVSRIHDDFLRQEKKLSKLEAIVTDKSYYFNLPFESDTVFNRKDQIYKSNKYGFKAEIKVGSLVYGEPKNVFDIGETEAFTFRGGKYTSIDVHKSQQEREFIVHLSFAEGSDSIFEGGGFISRAKINIEKEKRKYSYHLNQDHTKEEMSLVRVNVFTFNTRKYNNARPNKHAIYDIIYGSIYRKFT
ncbi:hypothetical protein LOTGIDRAFT_175830 [Lottia gigantea]|uniref:DNA-directed DNA polymerase n=1 Tax=Lottia gigantea TaxID=225164 RepID=V4BMP3_LOTGI|nr:hypothetical protein LOTGIDRAFT_175830 [Lottia gigantea]ESO90229.1 hypothetical protein LOTGIDRAFT_175830 [Lottia gigantea]